MEKCILTCFAGKKRPLHYSVASMFKVNDKFGSAEGAIDVLMRDDGDGFAALRFLAVLLANDAELCRRAAGYDPQPMLTEEDVSELMSPIEYMVLKHAISKTFNLGFHGEIDTENEEVDLGLLELRKNPEAGA